MENLNDKGNNFTSSTTSIQLLIHFINNKLKYNYIEYVYTLTNNKQIKYACKQDQ